MATNLRKLIRTTKFSRKILLFCVAKLLYVNGVFHLQALLDRWLVKLLTSTELFYDTCLLKLSLELLERALDVLAVLYWYNNHAFCFKLFIN